MTPLRVGVVTGGRADYGVLLPVLRLLDSAPDIELRLIVVAAHLSPEYGDTLDQILADGFSPAARVEMLLSSDTAVGVAKSTGLGVIGFADCFQRLELHLLVLMGDRFELLAAAQTALFMRIPIVHIAGGDVTTGAYDDAIRHTITKMSKFHLVTNEQSRRRVIQLGEHPDRVRTVGSPALDLIRQTRFLSRAELSRSMNFEFRKLNFLVTFHPVTLDPIPSADQLRALLDVLSSYSGAGVVITLPNADNEGRDLSAIIERWVGGNVRASCYRSLGQLRYLSCMREVDVVIGNSSSGLYEAPFLQTPTVDIGQRQAGRLRAPSVQWSPPDGPSIFAAIERARQTDCRTVQSLYGDGRSAPRILDAIRGWASQGTGMNKIFRDLEFQHNAALEPEETPGYVVGEGRPGEWSVAGNDVQVHQEVEDSA